MISAPRLTAAILTLNEARHITACIESLRWADRVVVFDSYSQDDTIALAREAGADILQNRFENYAQQRNAALERLGDEWVFFVDADERATPALSTEIRAVIGQPDHDGWWIPRHNYIFGHRMRGAGWWPDFQLRLLRRARVHYDPTRAVHETVILERPAGFLQNPLIHYNYETLAQFRAKQHRYNDYDVTILREQGIKPHLYTPYTQALRHFGWRFITLHGWRDGAYGLLLSTLMAYYEFLKYRKLRQSTAAVSITTKTAKN